ncbi:hypothetical protein A0256_14780 [Mucilaginibacter sp. PAMC 26640]|nr:hypothetical protein A0256_14780 [Mucilaginibacter sp. PAMC 26640]
MNHKELLVPLKYMLLVLEFLLTGLPRTDAQGIQQVQSNFDRYGQNIVQEKVFVHTSKSEYLTGEIIWFKVYCVDATLNKPINLSKVAYVEVLDNMQVPILQAKIAVANGMGSGSFVIPGTIMNGNYKLRAYTSWMKNFGPDYFFEKKITIINPLRSPVFAKSKPATYDVQFFPEGGNLVSGIVANVGFKAIGSDGLGIGFKGAIVNNRNDTVVRFQPLKFGMGQFMFTPQAGYTYKAVIKVAAEKTISKELPVINSSGYTMHLTDTGNGELVIKVNSNVADEQISLLAHTRGVTKAVQNTVTAGGTAQFTIGKNLLGEGISHLTIFGTGGQPLCERLYFKRPNQTAFVAAAADLPQYAARKKVNLMVAAKDAAGKLLKSGLSIAVYRVDSLQAPDPDEIFSYLWLSSDLQGHIESPSYYINNISAEAEQAADNLMLTQGWRRFNWINIVKGKLPALKFLPEYNGHIITVKTVDSVKGPAKNVTAYLAVPGKRVQVYPARSDADGILLFNTKDFYGANEIVIQTNTERDTAHKLEVLTPFYDQYSNSILPEFGLTNAMQASLQQQSLGMQVQNIYAGSKLKRFYEPLVDSAGFFGEPYKTYKLDDFTRFVTMEEVMREYVRETSSSRSQHRYHVTILGERGPLEGDPLVILDGVPVFNLDKLLAVDPLKVQRLQVVRRRYFYGPSVYDGILNYTTYKGDLGGTELDSHAIVVDYEGMQYQREFYSPLYETDEQQKSRLPDFRNLLFWSPEIKTGTATPNSVSFYTSDQTGKYFGIVQGITANGDAASQSFTFEVK